MTDKPTKLDELVQEAVALVQQLAELERSRKLKYKLFLAEGLRIAGVTEKRIDEVEKIVNEKPGADSVRRFVRKLASEFREARYVRPFPDASKAGRIYGSEQPS